MLFANRTRRADRDRLRGSDFDPPRKPDFLTRSPVAAFNDWRHATQKGKADAVGHNMSDDRGVPHAEHLIGAQADRAKEDQGYGFRKPKENATKVKEDAKKEQDHAGREITKIDEKDRILAEKEKPYEDRRGPGTRAYVAILAALFGLTFPIDLGAASWLPIPPIGQWMVAMFIGVLMVLCAHQAAKKIEDMEESLSEH